MSDSIKVLLALALLFVGLGGGRLLPLGDGTKPAVTPGQPEPSDTHKAAVAGVRKELAAYSADEKALWREMWTKAGSVIAADTGSPADFPTTTALREYVIELLTAGWVQLGGHRSGENPRLDAAVNQALAAIVTDKELGTTPELRSLFCDACNAIAWAAQ